MLLVLRQAEQGLALGLGIAERGGGGVIEQLPLLLDRALALLKPLAERQDSISPLACTLLADACHHAGDRSALAQLLCSRPAWAATPEGRLFAARLSATTDTEAAVVPRPQASLDACLDALQLPMHAGVLHPERNPRVPITLSHSQAREPIDSSSVGRWHHDDWLFGAEWEQLASLACG